jgi:hypothetical protein
LVSFVIMAGVLSRWSYRPLVFLVFAFLVLPAMLWNIGFHLGATAVYRTYCPGVITIDVPLLEGIYLLKRAFQRYYDVSIWIACSLETALQRALARGQEG